MGEYPPSGHINATATPKESKPQKAHSAFATKPGNMPLKLPPTYLLKTHFEQDQTELHRLEKEIDSRVWNIHEAELVLGRVTRSERAKHDLRVLGLNTTEVVKDKEWLDDGEYGQGFPQPPTKRRKVEGTSAAERVVIELDSSTASEPSTDDEEAMSRNGKLTVSKMSSSKSSSVHLRSSPPSSGPPLWDDQSTGQFQTPSVKTVKVLKLSWYYDSVKANRVLTMEPYLVYEGRIIPREPSVPVQKPSYLPPSKASRQRERTPPQIFSQSFRKNRSPISQTKTKPSRLHHEDTSDHEREEVMPPIPAPLKTTWSCQRATPLNCPNDEFISQLKIIRRARELESDAVIGHHFSPRAYSAAIATIQAYPHTFTATKEIMRLPNCGEKIGALWQEWKEYGEIEEVKDIEKDDRLKCLEIFYGIFAVGEATAREFHDKNGWRDLDDVTQYGWSTLTRDQQIGVKYYDEFALKIPRAEVEATGAIVLKYANAIHPGFHMCIVGGYRRGKPFSSDMDFILSHPDEHLTKDFLGALLDALGTDQGAAYITHELTVSFKNSDRGQETLAWRGPNRPRGRRSGFDTLDHAFVVWQDPDFAGTLVDLYGVDGEEKVKVKAKNPNVHRRVDIIISPWKTAGCAILGWSGGQIFERDLRRYSRKEKGWKFDSSGVRDVATGKWIDLESRDIDNGGENGVTLEEKERRVFEGLGLEYRTPEERCTH